MLGKMVKRIAKDAVRHGYWAVASRLPETCYPYPFPGGRIYLNIADSPAMLKRVLRVYERQKRLALSKVLGPGMTFIDVGANIGDFSLIAARLVGPAGRVTAFEPDPANCVLLRRSIAVNNYCNIDLQEMALSDADGHAVLHLGERGAWNSLVSGLSHRDAGAIDVRTRALDTFLAERGYPSVHAIKIDVEGAELSVLRGAEQTLIRNPGVVLFLDLHPHLGVSVDEVQQYLSRLGFRFYRMGNPASELSRLEPTRSDVLVHRAALVTEDANR